MCRLNVRQVSAAARGPPEAQKNQVKESEAIIKKRVQTYMIAAKIASAPQTLGSGSNSAGTRGHSA